MLNKRFHQTVTIAAFAVAGWITSTGCSDRPHKYGRERPPVDELDDRDKGLQSKDVITASDQMAQDLLALPELNESQHKWTIVVDRVENHTTSNRFDLNIFLERLRTNLSKYGHGRIALIENKDQFHGIQSRELEGEREGDPYGQGSGAKSAPGPRGIQPDFGLYARITEMPNRGTSFYVCRFTLTNLQTREDVWTNEYDVKVAR